MEFTPRSNDPQLATAAEQRLERRAGRFAEHEGLGAVRALNAVLCRFAPALAARWAWRQLATPPRAAESDWQSALRRQAHARRVPFGSGDLAVLEWGRGPAVLLVHGWGSHATHLGRMVLPLVNAGYRVVAFDAPAHGESGGRSTDLVQYASAITGVARQAGPLHAVVGHSFGAAMAMYAARDWGMEAGRMVLVSSFDHCNWFMQAFGEQAGLSEDVLERLRQRLVRLYGGRLDWSRMSVVDMVRTAGMPVLVVHDSDDQEIPWAHGQAIASASARATFHGTHGLGHQRIVRHAAVIGGIVRFLAA